MTYQIQVHDQNHWNKDGSPIIIRNCGHKHRTLTGAHKCFKKLCGRLSDGMFDADWYRGEIYHENGEKLNSNEEIQLFKIEKD